MIDQEIKDGEYSIANTRYSTIFTKDLNSKIAISIYAPKLQKAALGRNLTSQDIIKLFIELNPNNLIEESLFEVIIVGGNESQESEDYCIKLINTLKEIDDNKNIINIIGYDVGIKPHPNSIKLECFSGYTYSLENPSKIVNYTEYKKIYTSKKD